MAADNLIQAEFQGRLIERAFDPQGDRDVVSRITRQELIDEPEPLLSERQRQAHAFRSGEFGDLGHLLPVGSGQHLCTHLASSSIVGPSKIFLKGMSTPTLLLMRLMT